MMFSVIPNGQIDLQLKKKKKNFRFYIFSISLKY